MDRRSFLQAASAITGGLITKQRATAGQFTEKIKKAVKLHMVTGSASVEDKFRLLKELGFDGVETRVKLDAADKPLVQSYAAATEKIGLPIHGLIHSSNPDLIGAIDQAKFLAPVRCCMLSATIKRSATCKTTTKLKRSFVKRSTTPRNSRS